MQVKTSIEEVIEFNAQTMTKYTVTIHRHKTHDFANAMPKVKTIYIYTQKLQK